MDCYIGGTDFCFYQEARDHTVWDNFGTLFFVIFSGLFGSFWLLSLFFDKGKEEIDSDEEEELSYEEMYMNDLRDACANSQELDDAKLKALELSHVSDLTPRGMVTMLYNPSTESFWWFADKKDIPFSHLETVCRKYVSVFDCPSLYVSPIPEISDSENSDSDSDYDSDNEASSSDGNASVESEKSASEDNANDDANTNSVFVKLRKFETDVGNVDSGDANTTNLPPLPCNRYSYRGKLADFKELQKAREAVYIPSEEDGKKNMSFEDFKKMQTSPEESTPSS